MEAGREWGEITTQKVCRSFRSLEFFIRWMLKNKNSIGSGGKQVAVDCDLTASVCILNKMPARSVVLDETGIRLYL